jgi:hypothetical protein
LEFDSDRDCDTDTDTDNDYDNDYDCLVVTEFSGVRRGDEGPLGPPLISEGRQASLPAWRAKPDTKGVRKG